MLGKILLTLLVIVGCVWVISARNKPVSRLKEVINPESIRRKRLFRNSAFGFMVIMILLSAGMIYVELGDRSSVMTVYVVNSQSGERTEYLAERDNIESNRFQTVDGKTVYIADIERIEVVENPQTNN
jgi:hypothetical protein